MRKFSKEELIEPVVKLQVPVQPACVRVACYKSRFWSRVEMPA